MKRDMHVHSWHFGMTSVASIAHVAESLGHKDARQTFRHDLPSLQQERLLYSIYHMFSGLTGRRVEVGFQFLAETFPAMETPDGAMPVASRRDSARAIQATELAS